MQALCVSCDAIQGAVVHYAVSTGLIHKGKSGMPALGGCSPMNEKKHMADKLKEKLVIGPSRRVSSCL